MGEFLFKLKLTNIDGVSLLDKRGYLTICINQEGIRDWFYHLQSSVYESKRRRKFWVKGPTLGGGGGLGNNRLARLYGSDNNIAEEDIGTPAADGDDNNNNVPRG